MLTPDEEKFLSFWADKRNRIHSGMRQFRLGLTIGIVMGIAILLTLATGWYTRANMVANSQSTPMILIIAIIIIAVFLSFFYRQFSQENNEQRYQELLAKKQRQKVNEEVQRDEIENGQVSNS